VVNLAGNVFEEISGEVHFVQTSANNLLRITDFYPCELWAWCSVVVKALRY